MAGKHKKLQFGVLQALWLPPKQQVRSSKMKEEKMQEKQTSKNAFQKLLGTQQGGRLTFSRSDRYQGTTKTHSKQWHYIQCIPLFPSFFFCAFHLFIVLFLWGHLQIPLRAFRFVGWLTMYNNLLTCLQKVIWLGNLNSYWI